MLPVGKVLLCHPPSSSVTVLLERKQVSHLMFSRPSLTFSFLPIYLFIIFLLQFCTWPTQIELLLPAVLCAEWLTAPGTAGEKLDGRRTDADTVASRVANFMHFPSPTVEHLNKQ